MYSVRIVHVRVHVHVLVHYHFFQPRIFLMLFAGGDARGDSEIYGQREEMHYGPMQQDEAPLIEEV